MEEDLKEAEQLYFAGLRGQFPALQEADEQPVEREDVEVNIE